MGIAADSPVSSTPDDAPPQQHSPLPGVNLMLIGGVGSGKTTAIKSWIKEGITPFCIFTEPSYEVIADVKCPDLHWIYLPPASPSWDTMIDSATKVNQFSMETLGKMEGINKEKYGQFISLLTAFHNYKCARCGFAAGDVSKWGTDRVVVLDSLSGLNIMAMDLVVGSKPIKTLPNWGVAMDNEERLIQKLCVDKRCHFMLTAHSEREVDEALGSVQIMASALGRKMAPKLPRFFSDVVFAKAIAGKSTTFPTSGEMHFTWSTVQFGTDLKARNLPYAEALQPTVAPIIASWRSRGGIIEKTA